MMDKKQLLLNYLDYNLFAPVMSSPETSQQIKHDFEHTRSLLQEFSAEGILYYVWTMLANNDSENILNNRLMDEGFNNFNTVVDQFKNEFTFDWLTS